MDRDRILSSTEVQQLSQSIRSNGKVKAMIQAFSKGIISYDKDVFARINIFLMAYPVVKPHTDNTKQLPTCMHSIGTGTGSTTQDDDNSPTLSTRNNSQTNSQLNSIAGTPQDSPRHDEDASCMKNISPARPVDVKISSSGTGCVPPVSPPAAASRSHNYPSSKETLRAQNEVNNNTTITTTNNNNNNNNATSTQLSAKNSHKKIDRSPSGDTLGG